MNTITRRQIATGLFLTALAVIAQSTSAAGNNPVCAPQRDVSSVLGNGAPVIPLWNCQTERKVMAGDTGPGVAEILGRGAPVGSPGTELEFAL